MSNVTVFHSLPTRKCVVSAEEALMIPQLSHVVTRYSRKRNVIALRGQLVAGVLIETVQRLAAYLHP
jgi:hypothetical protein